MKGIAGRARESQWGIANAVEGIALFCHWTQETSGKLRSACAREREKMTTAVAGGDKHKM